MYQSPRLQRQAPLPAGAIHQICIVEFVRKVHFLPGDGHRCRASRAHCALESGLDCGSSVSPRIGGGELAVLYHTRWVGLTSASWEIESALRRHRRAIFLYWAGTPNQRSGERNSHYFTMRRCVAARELYRKCGQGFIVKGQYLVPCRQFERLSTDASEVRGVHTWFKKCDDLWWLGIVHEVGSTDRSFVVRFLDNPGPVKATLQPALYPADPTAASFSWCLQ